MAAQSLRNYNKERIGILESIFESTNFLKNIYNGKDKSNNLKVQMYQWERERLVRILKRYIDLLVRYRPSLKMLSDRGSEEVSVCEGVIRGALDVIDAAPSQLRKLKNITATSNRICVEVVNEVKPVVVNVVNEITEVVLSAVKRTSLAGPKCVVTFGTESQNISPPVVLKKPSIRAPVLVKVEVNRTESCYLPCPEVNACFVPVKDTFYRKPVVLANIFCSNHDENSFEKSSVKKIERFD
eukprot:TCONS_00015795-protein